jgi:ABC-type nickel/cobalt efflux system permease component RcnA
MIGYAMTLVVLVTLVWVIYHALVNLLGWRQKEK